MKHAKQSGIQAIQIQARKARSHCSQAYRVGRSSFFVCCSRNVVFFHVFYFYEYFKNMAINQLFCMFLYKSIFISTSRPVVLTRMHYYTISLEFLFALERNNCSSSANSDTFRTTTTARLSFLSDCLPVCLCCFFMSRQHFSMCYCMNTWVLPKFGLKKY